LIPRLPRIRARHPALDIKVIADPRLLDLRAERIDLAVRFCRSPHPSYLATRLMGDRVFPVCSPDLLNKHAPVDCIEALLALPLLHDSATDGDGSATDWRAWLAYHGKPEINCEAGQHFSDASMLIEAAVLGLGVALARASLVAGQIASGALVCPLMLVAPAAFTYYLLGLPEAVARPRIAAFREILVEEAATTEAFMLGLEAARSNRLRHIRELAAA
jgi:LysR family glycine cleavage system transcriptional activator